MKSITGKEGEKVAASKENVLAEALVQEWAKQLLVVKTVRTLEVAVEYVLGSKVVKCRWQDVCQSVDLPIYSLRRIVSSILATMEA